MISDGRLPLTGSVVISGAGLGLPGRGGAVFNDANIRSILNGEIRIEALPDETRERMLDKNVTRLIKSEAGAVMQVIDQMDQTIKLAGQRGSFDLTDEFGVPADRVEATDISTQLAIAAGIEALRDAGIPLVMAYRQTSKGTYLPDRWKLPEALADETGVVFGSAFPGLDEMAEETGRSTAHQGLVSQINELNNVLGMVKARSIGSSPHARKPHPRAAGRAGWAELPVRPPLRLPDSEHGTFTVRRVYRRARAEHARQRCLRHDDPCHRGC